MEQNLYIPWDLVMYEGNMEVVVEVDRDNTLSVSTDKHPFARIEKIKPIPLTPEILEKNGWKKERIYYTNKFIPRIKLYTCEEGYKDKWSVSINGDIIGGYIYHVHQLQHILFGLGFNSIMEV